MFLPPFPSMSRPPSVSHSCVSVLARRGLGPCWAPTATGSGQALGLWSPGPAGSWWVPGVVLCQACPRLCLASPCPACGQEPGSGHILAWSGGSSPLSRGQCSSAVWWSWGPPLSGLPTSHNPGSCSGLGQVLGVVADGWCRQEA